MSACLYDRGVCGVCVMTQEALVHCLGEWCSIPVTYAGGVRDLADVEVIRRAGRGKVRSWMSVSVLVYVQACVVCCVLY